MKRKLWIARSVTALVAAGMLALAFPAAAFADDGDAGSDASSNDTMDYSQSDLGPSVDPALDLGFSLDLDGSFSDQG